MKSGWQECQTRSVPAQEIEAYVLQRLKAIGRDPRLAAEIAAQARAEHDRQLESLRAEKTSLQRSVREQARAVAGLFGQLDASARIAQLEARIRAGERRLQEIAAEIAALGPEPVEAEAVFAALAQFDAVAATLMPAERERLVRLLVERVAYDGAKSTVSITFRPAGIQSISSQPQSQAA